MKKCARCKESLPVSSFNRMSSAKDGLQSYCKRCSVAHRRENPKASRVRFRRYNRERRQVINEACRLWRKRFPRKLNAQRVVSRAVKAGKIVRPNTCSTPGCKFEGKPHGHHDDYAKPLEVRWLCPACHSIWHADNGEGLNAG